MTLASVSDYSLLQNVVRIFFDVKCTHGNGSATGELADERLSQLGTVPNRQLGERVAFAGRDNDQQ